MEVMIDGVEYAVKIELMPMGFGEFLRAARKSIGYTLDVAAEKIACSKSYVWEIENGACEPSLKMAKRISEAYGVPIETLASYF